MTPGPNRRIWLVLLTLNAAFAGCERQPPGARARQEATPALGRSPIEAARQLTKLHHEGAYDTIGAGIVPDQRDATIELLRAVDEVLTANRYLRRIAEKEYSGPASETWNLDAMENNLGVFSKDVAFINQSFVGNRAFVTLQEGDNVPLVHLEFEQHDGCWLHRPEPTPKAVTRELRILAAILWDLCDKVRAGEPVDRFAAAFVARVEPQMRRVVSANDTAVAISSAE